MELKAIRRNGSVYKDRLLSETINLFKPHHALSVREYAKLMDKDLRHAQEFITRIERLGVIFVRYTKGIENFYSLRVEDEI